MFDLMVQQARQVVTCGLCRGELADVIEGAGRAIAALTSLQTRCATAIEGLDDGGVNSKTVLREAGRMSTRAANSVAKTAAGLTEMPKLAESLADGAITAEHAAVAVAAAAKTSAEQVDDELLKLAETSSVDVFAQQSRRWVNRNQVDDGADAHAAQRRNRSVKHWVNDEGMGVLLAELDQTSYQQVQKAINVEYDRLWRDDGGRDGSPADVRTPTQRLADAFVALITDPGRRGPASARMQLTAVVDVERLQSNDPSSGPSSGPIGVAEIVGGEALPQTVLERLRCMATVTGVVFDGKGQPIWVGRDHRHATEAQVKAIIARDRHCTGCAAGADRCEIHHIVPWEHGGRTDIDNMCLACSACHHNIHDRGYIVTKTNTGYKIVNPNAPPQG
ncbi:MAG: DUF222 domain-containing protein, partial [Acidimicrobiaceae bacterium]|nr:DUF222 domain-containing protein [Acidimicrobiaceae bacterium]MYG56354.1 DUF222 domain-containing protein [Acidimicrobiaceae bacterium]MYJ98734.1 DUF222 domain-containing protein [Acidimicrobiaceae bacterium]